MAERELLRDEVDGEAEVEVVVGELFVREPTVHSGRSEGSPGSPNQSGPLEVPPDSVDPAELRAEAFDSSGAAVGAVE
ncbi:hypothetical protein [Kribbella sp. NPDC006257]|uniref:hypothetical protein n=1 Tax=Kribbella sp. NPDC006257 TaxID=3156738 RepID=UPI0033B96825